MPVRVDEVRCCPLGGVKSVEYSDFGNWLVSFLPGRALLWEELCRAVREHGWAVPEEDIRRHVDRLRQTGAVEVAPGVIAQGGGKGRYRGKGQYLCRRCGEETRFFVRPCQSCGQMCATCEACLSMGRCRSCTELVMGRGTPEQVPVLVEPVHGAFEPALLWDSTLTLFQRQAAEMAVQLVRGEWPEKELLIHAVTGAGKTEMTFPAIAEALRRGRRVGVVTPRRDVVLELFPRMGQAFPNVPVAALYAGAPDRWAMAPLMVMTAHQALRFRRAFGLLVVDEVDAFPFHHEPLLPRAVAGALAHGGRLLYLTATPPDDLLQRVFRGEVRSVTIPQRHHGHPLPVPRWEPVRRLRQKLLEGVPVPALDELVQVVRQTEGRLLIFVPRVDDVPLVVGWWRRQYAEWASRIDGTHAEDEHRQEKVAAFRDGRLHVLVTTTILERGVTISRCHVLVLMADAAVFDAAGLVQIAGRAGRDAAFPTGEVWFCAESKTEAMEQARRQIAAMNRQAGEGLLKERLLKDRRLTEKERSPARSQVLSPGGQRDTQRGNVRRSHVRRRDPAPAGGVAVRFPWQTVLQSLLRWLNGEPERCVFCNRPAFQAVDWERGVVSRWIPDKPGTTLCGRCLAQFVWLTGDVQLCPRCGRLLDEDSLDDASNLATDEGQSHLQTTDWPQREEKQRRENGNSRMESTSRMPYVFRMASRPQGPAVLSDFSAGRYGDGELCWDCRRWVAAGAALFGNRSVAVYRGELRKQWHAYKYGGRRSMEPLWGEMLAYGWRCHRDELGVPDEIVYVPMHPAVLKERGFNHAQVLACELAERLGVPVAERLQRVSAAVRQSGQSRAERLRTVDGVYRLAPGGEKQLAGKHILLVDDIYTTGSTLEACARQLCQAGARRVVSLTLARA